MLCAGVANLTAEHLTCCVGGIAVAIRIQLAGTIQGTKSPSASLTLVCVCASPEVMVYEIVCVCVCVCVRVCVSMLYYIQYCTVYRDTVLPLPLFIGGH